MTQNGFSERPDSADMVTEHCSPTGTDLLCVACGWQGHAELPSAPWPVFQSHRCKLRIRSVAAMD